MNALILLAVLGTGQVTTPAEKQGTTSAENSAEKGNVEKWLEDYGAALKQAQQQGKPLLIVIDRPGDAAARFSQISHTDASPSDVKNADLKSYVLCRVDADTKYGQAVAKAFGATTLPYTAVIDKKAEHVLFTKQGQFSSQEWATTLSTYSAGVRPVALQSVVEQTFSGSSYCPSCQRGR